MAKCSSAPGFQNGKCSGAPGFRNGKCSGVPGANVKRPVQVLQDSKTEKCLQVGCHWKVKMIRAGYLTLIDFGSLIDLELPPSSFRSLGYWIWLDYCNEITKVNSSLAPCLVSFED
ncbi:unnamed protein product [Rhizophagus irregularis]|nr:unnamed protein product [Rhizophagus irregularis]CAB5383935.1 unnamed protein product [Rhizophagus irregularis]